ncbi:hypothetical protein [Amycolatopsis lexingtonensis]|uniref:hypothetical protein n=1 Tax=Amycolatopsis lexingtonensis TaxID=218822 RepID=UPI003F71E1DE
MTDTTPVLAEFLRVFACGDTAYYVGSHFTCVEANALADLLFERGDAGSAQAWINGHYEDCDYPEDHRTFNADTEKRPSDETEA